MLDHCRWWWLYGGIGNCRAPEESSDDSLGTGDDPLQGMSLCGGAAGVPESGEWGMSISAFSEVKDPQNPKTPKPLKIRKYVINAEIIDYKSK